MIMNVDFESSDPTIMTGTTFDIVFSEINTSFSLDFGEVSVIGAVEPYDGPYSFKPIAKSEQVISTSKKYLENDITIEAIPYAEVSNTSDGLTVTIG